MYTKGQEEKIDKICQSILEMAKGNFSYRIDRSGHLDLLDKVIIHLNMMAEEIRESFHHFALINPHETYKQVAQMTFILDDSFRIRNINGPAQHILGLEPSHILGRPFQELLTKDSWEKWENEMADIQKKQERYQNTRRFFFSSRNSLTVPSLCSISSLLFKKEGEKLYMVTALQTIAQSIEKEQNIQQKLQDLNQRRKKRRKFERALLHREADKKKIQEVYDYILAHLDRKLPNLKELAHQFGTNEFKLKVGFRQLFNTSVFQFQKEQRLRRAHSYISESELPLSKIASLCGFKSYPHFSKIFKKEYGYNPSVLQKKNRE